MKKILTTFLIILLVSGLFSCGEEKPIPPPIEGDKTVEFFGGEDMQLSLKTGQTFNPHLGISAMQGGNDISEEIIYVIYDVNAEKEVSKIDLSNSGTFKVTYKIKDMGDKYTHVRNVVVGNGKPSDFVYDINSLTYEEIFCDNFDGDSLDTSIWNYEIGTGDGGWGNNEKQYYTSSSENVKVENGKLSINALKQNKGNMNYTSGRITTKKKMEFKYGKVEAYAKLPTGRGTWPAIWMLSGSSIYGGWPAMGEIDIMEYVGYNPNTIHGTVHNQLFNGSNGQQKGGTKTNVKPFEGFHKYSIEWLPDKIIFSMDDVSYFEYNPKNYVATVDSRSWPYDTNFFLIMNVAIGGNWGGIGGIDDTIFPCSMEVDYIKVFQAKEFIKYL